MSINKAVYLRHRSSGHVRFSIPSSLCAEPASSLLKREIAAIPGIGQVEVYRRQKKLSIRYREEVLDFVDLASQLSGVIPEIAEHCVSSSKTDPIKKRQDAGIRDRLYESGPVRWVREKYEETAETVSAARVLANKAFKRGGGLIEDPERSAITFINDILVFYLIKIHWTPITQRWLPHPIRYRYEWMTVIYLIYLLMRSRRKK